MHSNMPEAADAPQCWNRSCTTNLPLKNQNKNRITKLKCRTLSSIAMHVPRATSTKRAFDSKLAEVAINCCTVHWNHRRHSPPRLQKWIVSESVHDFWHLMLSLLSALDTNQSPNTGALPLTDSVASLFNADDHSKVHHPSWDWNNRMAASSGFAFLLRFGNKDLLASTALRLSSSKFHCCQTCQSCRLGEEMVVHASRRVNFAHSSPCNVQALHRLTLTNRARSNRIFKRSRQRLPRPHSRMQNSKISFVCRFLSLSTHSQTSDCCVVDKTAIGEGVYNFRADNTAMFTTSLVCWALTTRCTCSCLLVSSEFILRLERCQWSVCQVLDRQQSSNSPAHCITRFWPSNFDWCRNTADTRAELDQRRPAEQAVRASCCPSPAGFSIWVARVS